MTKKNKEWREKWNELYGDDFDGGLRDKYADFIQSLLDQQREEIIGESNRLKSALNYINLLANQKDPHLGRPRNSDKFCIFCMSYFALNNGAYGHSISERDFNDLINQLKK